MGEMDLDIDVNAINRPVLFRLSPLFDLGLVEPVVDNVDNRDIALLSCTRKLVSVTGRDLEESEPTEANDVNNTLSYHPQLHNKEYKWAVIHLEPNGGSAAYDWEKGWYSVTVSVSVSVSVKARVTPAHVSAIASGPART